MLKKQRQKMPTLPPDERKKNFSEVSLGFNDEMAKAEAQRCLNCKSKPCVKGCPLAVDIPGFIGELSQGNVEKAHSIIMQSSIFPSICSRVCPQEKQCEGNCVMGIKGEAIAIGALERYAADKFFKSPVQVKNGRKRHKVAVIGSGPAGLACAGELIQKGYDVTVYEALHLLGGVLTYGIPEFRLPKKIVGNEINKLKNLGVQFETDTVIWRTLSLEDIFKLGFAAVFIAAGAGLPKFMGIEGENLNGVYSANEFLTRVNLMNAHKDDYDTPLGKLGKVIVVGGGNVAIDAARVAKRLSKEEVFIVYRRSENELPTRLEEIKHAKEEGIKFKFLTLPKKILADENDFVRGIECTEMELSGIDESGRKKVTPKKDSTFFLEADTVIIAIGTTVNPLIKMAPKSLKMDEKGGIIVDEPTMVTSLDGVFAGGDAISGSATVIFAMGCGKKAAYGIDNYIKKREN